MFSELLQSFGTEDARSMMSGFSTNISGFQTGTDYVPRTGIYRLHEGEKVISSTTNNSNMGGVTININGARDPKQVADEVAKVLKYGRSSALRAVI